MSEDDETVFQAIRAGARGYLLKGAGQEEVLRAVRSVAAGSPVGSRSSSREQEILDLLAAGRSNPRIAQALCLSPKTVRNNVSSIFATLHLADRAEAIIRARDVGLGR